MDLVNSLILTSSYHRGNMIIPYVLLGLLFYGIYFNLSLWYKLSDKTYFGAYFGIIGMVITVGLDFILIGQIGMLGGAIALLCGYAVMMIVSYLIGQRHYKVPYDLKKIALYFLVAVFLYIVNQYVSFESLAIRYSFKIILIASYILFFLFINGLKLRKTNFNANS
jgi:O-antigen/teichoic acid export membrane protein